MCGLRPRVKQTCCHRAVQYQVSDRTAPRSMPEFLLTQFRNDPPRIEYDPRKVSMYTADWNFVSDVFLNSELSAR